MQYVEAQYVEANGARIPALGLGTFDLRGAAGIVEQADRGYELTVEGHKLLALYPELEAWAQRWAERSAAGH